MLKSQRDTVSLPPAEYREALRFLYNRIDYERSDDRRRNHRFRLERTEQLFEQLGLGRYLFRRESSGPSSQRASQGSSQPATTDAPPKPLLVHIAGTKGKGSTATMLGSILDAAGYRVGLYTSPHLTDLEERFRINGEPCSRTALSELVGIVAPVVDRLDDPEETVSFFELTTAMAVLHFDRNDCDVIILEVGLGGRLDSTNVCGSDIAAVTSIGLDHQRVLGNTLAEIAAEKAGIIKGGVPVISGVIDDGAADVIRRAATTSGSTLFEKDTHFLVTDSQEAAVGNGFTYRSLDPALQVCGDKESSPKKPASSSDIHAILSVDGAHQIHNASLAISIACLLTSDRVRSPLSIETNHLVAGLRTAKCIGRMERFRIDAPQGSESPDSNAFPDSNASLDRNAPSANAGQAIHVIVDTAHNQDSIAALCDSVRRRIGEAPGDAKLNSPSTHTAQETSAALFRRPLVVICAVSRDKDIPEISAILSDIADRMVCTTFTTNPRSLDAEQLAAAVRKCSPLVDRDADVEAKRLQATQRDASQGRSDDWISVEPDPSAALEKTLSTMSTTGGTVIICGSFFLAGELRPRLLAMPNLTRLDDWCETDRLPADAGGFPNQATSQPVAGMHDRFSGSQIEA